MKWMKWLSLVLAVLLVAACGNQDQSAATEEQTDHTEHADHAEHAEHEEGQEPAQSAEGEETAADTAEDAAETETGEAAIAGSDTPENVETLSVEAIFVGQADSHSIEVETPNQEALILQTIETDMNFDDMPSGTKLQVEYYEQNGQNIITSVEEVK